MWFDDADVQIVGMCSYDLDLKSKMEINKIVTDFNESMRYKNIIKRQDKAIKQLKVDLLEEQLKNAKSNLESKGDKDENN